MAAIGIVYTMLAFFELWRGRGDDVWRWPIMVLLLAHAAAIPIHIPLAGALPILTLLTWICSLFRSSRVHSSVSAWRICLGALLGSNCYRLSGGIAD